MPSPSKPLISVVIIAYNMAREIPRTVQSFLPSYQHGIGADVVEIIVIENGSSHPVPENIVKSWPQTVRYITLDKADPSPATALNLGVDLAMGMWVCPVIDGARMVTPGLFARAKQAMRIHDNPIIATLGYHLGDKPQQDNVAHGYNQAVEDALLDSIKWPQDPYKLYDISALGKSSGEAWLGNMSESNVLLMKKTFYEQLGGYDTAFNIPGGGLVNLDFFKRAISHPDSLYVLLIDEASFHQYHGGVTTSRSVRLPDPKDKRRSTWEIYAQQYQAIRGEPISVPKIAPLLFGERRPYVRRTALETAARLNAQSRK